MQSCPIVYIFTKPTICDFHWFLLDTRLRVTLRVHELRASCSRVAREFHACTRYLVGELYRKYYIELILSCPYKKTGCSIACCRPVFLLIFYPATCLYFNLQACENPVAVLPHRIVTGCKLSCGTVYLQYCRPVKDCQQAFLLWAILTNL